MKSRKLKTNKGKTTRQQQSRQGEGLSVLLHMAYTWMCPITGYAGLSKCARNRAYYRLL